MSKRGNKLYLEDIKSSIEKIESYVVGMNFEEFAKDMKTLDAVVRNLSIIGEAVNNLSQEIKSHKRLELFFFVLRERGKVQPG